MFPFANAYLFLSSRSLLLKDHVDLQPVVPKEGGTEDFRVLTNLYVYENRD